jgi:hypothetical protein
VFRALYYARDRAAFFRHVAEFTERKLVFDVAPRLGTLDAIRGELREAGWDAIAIRPFFAPQHLALPRPVGKALAAVERIPPVASLLLRYRFAVLVAAFRSGR